ncbi:MAG: Hpt domain-containing protein [Myxococcales bacterium]|nr:Hpt domain-containing protein [Myxococcales bacterium]
MRSVTLRLVVVASVVIMVGLATSAWLGRDRGRAEHDAVLQSVQRAQYLHHQLKQLVLASRFGLLRRYDPLVSAVAELEQEVVQLQHLTADVVAYEPELEGQVAALKEAAHTQSLQVDRFKSSNAILRNSLSYLPVSLRALQQSEASSASQIRAEGIVRLVLTYDANSSDPSYKAELLRSVDLGEREGGALSGDAAEEWTLLLRHARMVVEQHEISDPLLDAIVDSRLDQGLGQVWATYRLAHERSLWLARRARLGVLLFSGLLALLLLAVVAGLVDLYRTLDRRVRDRTAALDLKSRQLVVSSGQMRRILDNVAHGLAMVDPDGVVLDHRSRKADDWLGTPEPGATLWAWLGHNDPSAAAWLEVGWMQLVDGLMPPEAALAQLPARAVAEGRSLGLTYQQVGDEGVLVVFEDITAALAQAKLEAERKEAMVLFERLTEDREGFLEFVREGGRMVRSIRRTSERAALQRVLHTLKGNSAVMGLTAIAERCHVLETRLLDDEALEATDLLRLEDAWDGTVMRMRPFLLEERRPLHVYEEDVGALVRELRAGAPPADLVARISSWAMEPTRIRLERMASQAERMAGPLGKRLEIEVNDSGLRTRGATWAPVWASFVHLLRNAMDHGIELPGERTRLGKPAAGRLLLTTRRVDDWFDIVVSDDGRGIHWDKLRQRAAAMGLQVETLDDAELLFANGLSSKDETTRMSGRGTGMAALQEAVASLGGVVTVTSTPGQGTEFRCRFPAAAMGGPGALERDEFQEQNPISEEA